MARSFAASSSQSIDVASAASINFGSSDFTVLAWVRFPAAPANDAMIIGKRAGGFDGDEGWELKFNNGAAGSLRWDVETDITGRQRAEGTATGINNGNWHLIGGDRDTDTQLRLWFDGAIANTAADATAGSVNTTTPLVIAAAYNTPNTNFLTGEIGPVFAFNRLLTLAEHQMLAAGFSPRFLRPLPVFLAELLSRGSPEPDIIGGLTGTLVNGPGIAPNPRLVFPRTADIDRGYWYEFANATIAGQSALTTTITRARDASATVAGQSATTAAVTVTTSLVATIAGQSAVTADISANVAPKSTIAGQSAITAAVNIDAAVGAEVEAQASIQASLSADVPINATISGQSALTAAATASAPIDATIAGQSALTVTGDRIRTLTTTIGGQSALSAAVTITAGVEAQIAAQSSVVAATSATAPAFAVVTGQSGVEAILTASVPAFATFAGASGVTATVTRAQPAAATIAGQSTLVADIAPRVPVETTIAAQSAITAILSATVPIQAGIDGESSIRARPTYPGTKKTITVGGVARWLATVGGRITR